MVNDRAMKSFSEFNFLTSLQKTLADKRLSKPTEIQAKVIPLMMNGESVVGISETGSGKTLAYALPLLHQLKELENMYDPVLDDSTPRAVIMVPTRELGEQIAKVFKTLTHDTRLRVRTALGGMALDQARRNVAGVFEILLATPGRLVQLLKAELIHLDDVRMLIFDEADQMMDEGFKSDSDFIAEACPEELQLGLFSATISPRVQELMDTLFAKANVIKSSGSGKVVKTLVTKNMTVTDGKRWPVLEKLLATPVEGGTLIFANTREQCDKIAKDLAANGYACAIYRGEMDKNERRKNYKRFRDGDIDILVATDVAGRGLDIENVSRVINYHLPQQMDNYLHRVGRTARAGRSGLVVNLVTERDEPLMAKLEGREPKALPRERTSAGASAKPRFAAKGKGGARPFEKGGKKVSSRPGSKPGPGGRPSSKPNSKPNAKPKSKFAGKPGKKR
jgi:superfamily II DNA/RNA helicase